MHAFDAITIADLRQPTDADISQLADLLVDVVNGGGAVSFLAPLAIETAADWWRKTFRDLHERSRVFVARDSAGICGTVQLQSAWQPNQPQRADVAKLMVHPRCRGVGLAVRLMAELEQTATLLGFRLLILDTRAGSSAERLYRRLGWICAGSIPDFALDPDGRAWHDDVIFYKRIEPRPASLPAV